MNTWRNLPGKALVSLISCHPFLRRRARRAAEVLEEHEREIFLGLNRYDLAHSLAVAARLRDDPLLVRAALLHDAGKLPRELSLWTRWMYTALEVFFPSRLKELCREVEKEACGDGVLERMESLPPGWKRGLFVQVHHGEIAGELLRRKGSEETLVRLVEGHQGEPGDERARRLRSLDDRL